MTRNLIFLFFVTTTNLFAQVSDDFTDGDFINNPTWSGDDSEFRIDESSQLRLNNTSPATNNESYLSVSSEAIYQAEWQFNVGFDGLSGTGLSGSNRMFIYLVSDRENLEDNPQGYYVLIGNSNDEISLYSSLGILIDGVDGTTENGNANITVRVTRDANGNWELLRDLSGGNSFTSEGTANNTDFVTSAFFGVLCDYSSTRSDKFFFDSFSVIGAPIPDTDPPTIQAVNAISDTQVDVTFNENVDEITAGSTGNYVMDGGVSIVGAVRDEMDHTVVHLTTDVLTNGGTYTLTVNNVEDESSNMVATNSQSVFEYLVFGEAVQFDVVINEFMADPNPVIGLPDAEFVELYNRSSKILNLENWVLDGQPIGSFRLDPDSYVIICEDDDLALFSAYTDVLAITTLSLNNSSADEIILTDDSATKIHSISFSGSTEGTSWELINPNGPDYSLNNYGLSTNPDGGTPGEQNSIFDDTPDTIAPTIASISVVSSSALDLTFDEPVEEITAETTDNYLIDGGITIGSAVRDDTDNSLVHLTVPALVSGEIRTLTVNGVTDLSSNAISANSTIDFEYIETEEAAIGDVVINEFYAIPDEESNLPNTEYIELLNISNKFIDLQNWTVSDAGGSSGALPSFILRPDSLVILIPPGETTSFEMFGDVIEVPSMKSLNNSGDDILISNENAVDIYQITYTSATPGISTELINPYGPDYSLNNYGLSTSPDGGTPGEQNSIFDDTPDTIAPTIASISVVSSSALDLTFNEPIEKTTAETAGNYSIDGGITVSTAMRNEADNSLVHLTVSELISTEERTLSISNVQDLSGNTVQPNANIDFVYIATVSANFRDVVINEFLSNPLDVTNDFVELFNRSDKFLNLSDWKLRDESSVSTGFGSFILSPGGYVIIHDEDAAIDYSVLGNSIAIPALTLNNTDDQIEILDDTDTRIDFLIYTDQLEEGISLELINPEDPCITEFSYSASTDISGHTAGAQNSIFDASPDTEAPSITSYGFDGALTIRFSEIMDANSLINGNYTIFGLSISGITVSEFPNSVTLNFLEQLNFGVIYQMTISAVMDCWGNELEETIISFGLGRSPGFNEVLITEIQFDPDPSVVLPDVEFLEIYNNTNNLINLEGLTLSDVSSQVELPMITMNPMEYYVLTTTSAAAEFTGVNAIGVSGFPSLSNSGEQLILSSGDELIFSINYNPAWHDEDKRSGGYTLEMKDLSSPCVEAFNWGSSRSSTGGTPGFKNSNTEGVPDNFGPEIVKVIAISHDSVRVDFNEKIDPVSKQLVSVTFKPDLNTAFFHFDNKLPATLFIILGEDLVESDAHKILIEGVVDCKGNEIQEHEISFAFPSPAEEGDILLSEVLFNPRTNGVDFVELLNVSEKYVSFMNWRLARITEEGIIDEKITSKNELILPPGEFLVFTTDPAVLLSNYPQGNSDRFFEMASLPTYANDTGNVVLLNDLGAVMEIFHYEDDYHYALLESTDGVSLERISYDVDVNDADNWRSASSTQGFATPGYANSQSLMITSPSGNVQAEPKVFIPGNSGSGRDFTTINYQFDQPGKFANVTIFDQTGRLVKNVAEGALLSTSGFMRWDGTTNRGNMARLGYYVILFEVYDSNGNTDTLKETVVVGRDF
ncbi:MAG: lamin tail domain-containing protein [Cyclobacteriaceae bacterium]